MGLEGNMYSNSYILSAFLFEFINHDSNLFYNYLLYYMTINWSPF